MLVKFKTNNINNLTKSLNLQWYTTHVEVDYMPPFVFNGTYKKWNKS